MTWWGVIAESKNALMARDSLRARGFDVFLPYERITTKVKYARSKHDVLKSHDHPIFGRYFFVEAPDTPSVREARGVYDVIKTGVDHIPIEVPAKIIAHLRAICDDDGMMTETDLSKVHYDFDGQVGDYFYFKDNSALSDMLGRLTSLSELDDSGNVRALVTMFGSEREVDVHYTAVGEIVTIGHEPPPNRKARRAHLQRQPIAA